MYSVRIDGDNVVFWGFADRHGVVVGDGDFLTPIVLSGDPAPAGEFRSGYLYQGISGANEAFTANTNAAPFGGVYAKIGGELKTIAALGDPAPVGTFREFNRIGINGELVAFEATYGESFSSEGNGLFVGNGDAPTTVVKTGDSLFGSTVDFLEFGRYGLDPDGSGSLAFYYSLADGRYGVAVASPVPEPATLRLVGAIAAIVCLTRKVVVS